MSNQHEPAGEASATPREERSTRESRSQRKSSREQEPEGKARKRRVPRSVIALILLPLLTVAGFELARYLVFLGSQQQYEASLDALNAKLLTHATLEESYRASLPPDADAAWADYLEFARIGRELLGISAGGHEAALTPGKRLQCLAAIHPLPRLPAEARELDALSAPGLAELLEVLEAIEAQESWAGIRAASPESRATPERIALLRAELEGMIAHTQPFADALAKLSAHPAIAYPSMDGRFDRWEERDQVHLLAAAHGRLLTLGMLGHDAAWNKEARSLIRVLSALRGLSAIEGRPSIAGSVGALEVSIMQAAASGRAELETLELYARSPILFVESSRHWYTAKLTQECFREKSMRRGDDGFETFVWLTHPISVYGTRRFFSKGRYWREPWDRATKLRDPARWWRIELYCLEVLDALNSAALKEPLHPQLVEDHFHAEGYPTEWAQSAREYYSVLVLAPVILERQNVASRMAAMYLAAEMRTGQGYSARAQIDALAAATPGVSVKWWGKGTNATITIDGDDALLHAHGSAIQLYDEVRARAIGATLTPGHAPTAVLARTMTPRGSAEAAQDAREAEASPDGSGSSPSSE